MKQPGIAAAVDPFTVVTQGRVSVVAVRVQSSRIDAVDNACQLCDFPFTLLIVFSNGHGSLSRRVCVSCGWPFNSLVTCTGDPT